MHKDKLNPEEAFVSSEIQAQGVTLNNIQATPIVEKYIEKRKDKADQQIDKEVDGLTHAKQTKSDWDEWVSYRYAIF